MYHMTVTSTRAGVNSSIETETETCAMLHEGKLINIFVTRSYTRRDTAVQYYQEVRMKKLFGSALVLGALSLSFGVGTAYGSMVGTLVTWSMLDCPVAP